MSQYLKEFKERYKGFFKRSRSLIMSSDWYIKGQRGKFKENAESFSHENNSALQVVAGLSSFIEGAEGERHLKPIQSYINEIVKIVDIHLERVSNYYLKNDPDKWTHADKKKGEEVFQQMIFQGENKVREKLNKLNISNNYENLEVNFHGKKKASIIYKTVLEQDSLDIKEKIKSLDIDWDLILDNGFFINMKESEIPKYNPRKNFFEQDKEVLQFYVSEWNKINLGYTMDGYYFHPWLYFHLNYFKIALPVKNERGIMKEIISNPHFRRNEWYFTEIIKKAEVESRGAVFIFGTRRLAKSVFEASYLLHGNIIFSNSETSLTIGNDTDRQSIMSKIDLAIKNMHPFLEVHFNIQDWDTLVEFGLKTTNSQKIRHSDLRVTNTAGGSKKASQKGAGGSPIRYVYDESGKQDFLSGWAATKYSFKTPEGWKAIPIFTGTGTNEDISKDAALVLNSPETYDFLPMDWELFEYKIPKEAITWKRRPFAFFAPGQMSYEEGMMSIKMKFSDFVDIESDRLDKITFYETDWNNNSKVLLENQKELYKTDKKGYQAYCVFLPTDPEHCFMSAENNPFPATIAKKQRDRLIAEGNETTGIAQVVTLRRDSKNNIISEISNKEVPNFPHQGGFVDAPILLYGDLPEEEPNRWTYVASLDDYKHEQSDGDSVGVLTVYKRDIQSSKDDGKIVAILATRPDPHGYFHQQIHLVLEKFNAICFPENEDMKIKDYFDRLGLSHRFLGESFDVSKKLSFTNTGNRKYGWQPGRVMTPYVIGLVIDYCKREFEIKDDDGNIVEIRLGVELIDDIYLLEEIIKYRVGGNFDRIISFGGALLYDHYLNITYKFPKRQYTKEQLVKKQDSMRNLLRNQNAKYTKTRRRLL